MVACILGCMGYWLALTNRNIQIRWKSSFSRRASSLRGIPQQSVLSLLLFMLDIFETAIDQVYVLLYADGIIIYAFGTDTEKFLKRLQDTLDRIILLCRAWKLRILVEKCVTISFSCSRDLDVTLKVMGHELPWTSSVKILGCSSLSFNYRFTYLRTKPFKRLKYLKALEAASVVLTAQMCYAS